MHLSFSWPRSSRPSARTTGQHGHPDLFKKYPNPRALAQAPIGDIEQAIRSTGFYRNKAKSIQGASQMLSEQYHGAVPDDMDQLTQLPGVARKTANVVLGNAFNKNEGVVVDTHVSRLSQRLGLTSQSDPNKIERDLMQLFPNKDWTMLAPSVDRSWPGGLWGTQTQMRSVSARDGLPQGRCVGARHKERSRLLGSLINTRAHAGAWPCDRLPTHDRDADRDWSRRR